MRAAIIENGIVQNIIVIADGYEGAVVTGELPVAIGDAFDGTDFFRGGEKVALPQLEEVQPGG